MQAKKGVAEATAPAGAAEDDREEMKMLEDLVGGIRSFMGNLSSFEGAEFPTGRGGNAPDEEMMAFLKNMQQLMGKNNIRSAAFSPDDSEEEEPDDFFAMGSSDTEGDDDEEEEEEGELSAAAEERRMRRLMKEMDRELQRTKLAEDFEKMPRPETVLGSQGPNSGVADSEAEEEARPVDVNLNLLKNILNSIEAQSGMAGPASNLLKELKDSNANRPTTS